MTESKAKEGFTYMNSSFSGLRIWNRTYLLNNDVNLNICKNVFLDTDTILLPEPI